MTDFYRMRYTETRIMLLDFTRSAHQIFNPERSVISDKGLLLGVGDKNVSYMANKDASVVAFVPGRRAVDLCAGKREICGRIQLSQKC